MNQSSPSQPIRLIRCPTCQKMGSYSPQNPFRPFCSERCKLQDTAQWATEGYRIPSQTPPEDEDISTGTTTPARPEDEKP